MDEQLWEYFILHSILPSVVAGAIATGTAAAPSSFVTIRAASWSVLIGN